MQVSDFAAIYMSRYGCEKRKCWSFFALAPMGKNGFFVPPVVVVGLGKKQGCQFSGFSLISDFLRIKACGMKYGKNMGQNTNSIHRQAWQWQKAQ